jgi:uracil-DNA glycosylase
MADPSFRDRMADYASNDRVGPLNRWISTLCDQHRWMPRIAPTYGGVEAEVLFLLQDPGPGTAQASASGFLSHQNDDDASELFAHCLDDADLPASRTTAWNASPWYRSEDAGRPSAAEVGAALPLLADLLDRLPRVRVVVPMGAVAQDAWTRFSQLHPARARAYTRIDAPHPADPTVSVAELAGALAEARSIIDTAAGPAVDAELAARRNRRACDRSAAGADRACRTA